MATASKISQALVQPHRIASLLNWNKSKAIMALNISKGMIDVAIARHPSAVNSNPGSKCNLDKGGHPCSFQINIPFPQERRHNVNPDHDADAGTHDGTHTDADARIHSNMNIDQVTNQLSSLVKDCNVCLWIPSELANISPRANGRLMRPNHVHLG